MSTEAMAKLAASICRDGSRPIAKLTARRRTMHRAIRPGWVISLGLMYWLMPKPTAQAQQAFLSALSLDSVIKSRSPTNPIVTLPPDQPHIGPVGIDLGAFYGVSLQNNIYYAAANPESDIIVNPGVTLGLAWQATGQSTLQINSGVGYVFYLNHPNLDYVAISPGSALTWGVGLGDWEITFFDQINYTRDVSTSASISNVSGIPLLNNTAGLRAEWKPGHWLISSGYSYQDAVSTSSAFNYLDNSANLLSAKGAWRFSDHGELGLEASASFTRFSYTPQSDNNTYSFGPYLVWPVDPSLTISLHGGPNFQDYTTRSSGQAPNGSTSYYINFDVTHQMTHFISEELSINRSLSLGYGFGANYTEELDVTYKLRWLAKSWLNFHLELDYQDGTQTYDLFEPVQVIALTPPPPHLVYELVPFPISENYSRYGISPGVDYQITKKMSASLGYYHWTRNSNISGNKYSFDSVNFQISYKF